MGDGTGDAFGQQVLRFRTVYQRKRQGTNLFPPIGQPVLDMELVHGTPPSMRIWYKDGTELGRYIHLFDLPGTLSGSILRLEQDLPSVSGHFEVEGDDISDLVAKLPVVEVNPDTHFFVKKGKYRSEIENLLLCQGGACPGTPASPHLVRPLGASPDGELVFEKLSTRASTLGRFSSLRVYKTWILGLIDAVACLHSLGIVHRDLRIDNFLFTPDPDGGRLVVCDLESRWGQHVAPEVRWDGGVADSGWSVMSDVYDMRNCVKGMGGVEWPVPEPLQAVVEACLREKPEERPTLGELRRMVEGIEAEGC